MNEKVVLFVFLIFIRGSVVADNVEEATFAGGCFWCMEAAFQGVEGVSDVVSGYMGGETENPTYENYAQGGYAEVIQITFNPAKISYVKLLDIFWKQIDPTDIGGQFADRGSHYRTIIFYHNEEQKVVAEKSKQDLAASGQFVRPIVTEILPATTFYPAEDYHQNYATKNPSAYKRYRVGSGRDAFLEKTWQDVSAQETPADFQKQSSKALRKKLTPMQYDVTQSCGTEPPFNNEFWDNKRPGIYVDIVSGEPLFSSKDKFASGTGWPSFTRPLESKNIVEQKEGGWFDWLFGRSRRTEVRSKNADSHLGHVFQDGPQPTGLRYCINSASLRFIPVEDLEREGYGEYKKLFEEQVTQEVEEE